MPPLYGDNRFSDGQLKRLLLFCWHAAFTNAQIKCLLTLSGFTVHLGLALRVIITHCYLQFVGKENCMDLGDPIEANGSVNVCRRGRTFPSKVTHKHTSFLNCIHTQQMCWLEGYYGINGWCFYFISLVCPTFILKVHIITNRYRCAPYANPHLKQMSFYAVLNGSAAPFQQAQLKGMNNDCTILWEFWSN